MKNFSLKKNSIIVFSTLFLLAIFCSLTSCKKDPNTELGNNLHNSELLKEYYVDTVFDILAYSEPDTSYAVQNPSRFLLGSFYDEVFGSHAYSFYTQLAYSSANSSVIDQYSESTAEIDSVVLELPYSGLYPISKETKSFNNLKFALHELLEPIETRLSGDEPYKLHETIAYNPEIYSGHSFDVAIAPLDTVYDSLTSTKRVLPLRLRLNNDFGKKLMAFPDEAYNNGTSFSEHYNGICLVAQMAKTQDDNSLCSFSASLDGSRAKLFVYYHPKNGSVSAVQYVCFVFDSQNMRFTSASHNYEASQDQILKDYLSGSRVNAKYLYISSTAGLRTKIEIPNFKEIFEGKKVVINKAELDIYVDEAYEPNSVEMPLKLQIDSIDDNASGFDPMGSYNKDKKLYTLNITRELQSILYRNKENPSLSITASIQEKYGTPVAVRLCGLDGKNRTKNQREPRLRLVYTLINQ